ncbi:MAG: amidohydrolase family protein [Proteobacteria bacterium]|nr:amidohydrolase family protein [Pseudomonadota bacterium]
MAIVTAAEEEGIDIKWHVNGDAAVTATLDALEAVSDQNGGLEQIHSFEHVVLVNEADLARMQTLGVIASIQPVHYVVSGLGKAPDEWGDERYGRSYDFAAFEAAGIELAMGTDWPVWPTVDPLVNIWAGTNARDAAVLTAAQGIEGYTEGTAATLGFDDLGHLSVGVLADVVVFDADPLTVDEGDLTGISVEAVYVGGRKVY